MIVNSVWKSLAEAQLILTDAGCSQEEAQRLICQGIADRVVKIRCKLGRHKSGKTASKTYLEGDKFQVPVAIAVEEFDWEKSRPVKTWYVERGGAYAHGEWTLKRIEALWIGYREVEWSRTDSRFRASG